MVPGGVEGGGGGGGGLRRACKNTAAYKCEQVPVVGGCVYSGRGVKESFC